MPPPSSYPARMYHQSTEVYARSGYATYPITVQNEEEYLGLEDGWHTDPVAAGEWVATVRSEEQADDAGSSDAGMHEDTTEDVEEQEDDHSSNVAEHSATNKHRGRRR